ncbi:MAG: DUF4179 domain-containing protein [Sarcina sp.]
MKKDIFDMVNDSDINLDDYEREELDDIEKMKMKKFAKGFSKKKKINFVKAAGVCAVLGGGFLITPFGQNVIASINLPTYELEYLLNSDKEFADYKTVVDQSISDNGVTIKLNEVVLDEDMFRVSSTIHIENKEKKYNFASGDGIVYINGKRVSGGGGGGLEEVGENTFASCYDHHIDLEKVDLSKPLDIKIKIRNVEAYENQEGTMAEGETVKSKNKSIKGNWDFEFTVDPSEILGDTKIIESGVKVENEDGNLTIDRFTSNKIGEKLYVTFGKRAFEDHSIQFTGTDNLGNKIEFGLRYRENNKAMFESFDLDGYGISDKATEIILQAEVMKYPETNSEMLDEYVKFGEPFTIKIK